MTAKPPRDPNQLAKSIIGIATGRSRTAILRQKNRARTRLRFLKGGLKGGAARAASITAKQRSAIAKKAAAARWK
jgi:hypothetical protein